MLSTRKIIVVSLLAAPLIAMDAHKCKSIVPENKQSYTSVINTVLEEERRLILESSSYNELRTKIKALPCPVIREKVSHFIDNDLQSLHDSVQTQNSKKFLRLTFGQLTSHVNTCDFEDEDSQDDIEAQKVTFTSELCNHINAQIAQRDPKTLSDLAVKLKRMQLYSEYLKSVAQYETQITSYTKTFLFSTTLMYFPLQVMAYSMNQYAFLASMLAQVSHLCAVNYLEDAIDYSRDEESHYILDIIEDLHEVSKKSAVHAAALAKTHSNKKN